MLKQQHTHDLLDMMLSNDTDRYGAINKVGLFKDGIAKIYSNYYDSTRMKVNRLKDGVLLEGDTKQKHKEVLAENTEIMQSIQHMTKCYYNLTTRSQPSVNVQYILKDSILMRIKREGELLESLLNNTDYEIPKALDTITNKKVRVKVVSLLAELDEMPDVIEPKRVLPTRGNTIAEDLICDLRDMLLDDRY